MNILREKVSKFFIIMIIPILIMCFMSSTNVNNNTEGDVNIKHNGKGNFSIMVESEKTEEDFKTYIDEKVFGFNSVSGDTDIIEISTIKKKDNCYNVLGKFRRIDKVMINGNFEYKKISEYLALGSEGRTLVKNWNNGSLSCTVSAFYENRLGQITIPKGKIKDIKPYSVKENKIIPVNQFYEESEKNKQDKIITFRMLDLGNVKRITVSLPGKITYYGGKDIKLIDDNTFEVEPIKLNAQILRNKSIIDENGNEIIQPNISNEEINGFMGYIVYKASVSPVIYVMISLLCVILVSLVIWFYIAMVRRGKRVSEN